MFDGKSVKSRKQSFPVLMSRFSKIEPALRNSLGLIHANFIDIYVPMEVREITMRGYEIQQHNLRPLTLNFNGSDVFYNYLFCNIFKTPFKSKIFYFSNNYNFGL